MERCPAGKKQSSELGNSDHVYMEIGNLIIYFILNKTILMAHVIMSPSDAIQRSPPRISRINI